MKRLVSVMILASIPVACGTQVATTPDDVTVAAQSKSAPASPSGVPLPICVPGDRSHVRAIDIVVLNRGKGWVTVRAVISSSEATRPVCLDPWWSVSPVARIDTKILPDHATIYGTPGKYNVTALSRVSRPTILSATVAVTIE